MSVFKQFDAQTSPRFSKSNYPFQKTEFRKITTSGKKREHVITWKLHNFQKSKKNEKMVFSMYLTKIEQFRFRYDPYHPYLYIVCDNFLLYNVLVVESNKMYFWTISVNLKETMFLCLSIS